MALYSQYLSRVTQFFLKKTFINFFMIYTLFAKMVQKTLNDEK